MASNTGGGALSCLQIPREACTRQILEAKKLQGKTWEEIANAVGRSPVWVTSCCLGENSMDKESAEKLTRFLGIPEGLVETLCTPCPMKGQTLPASTQFQDPFIYRFHEISLVYGLTLKELIQEKFGDGIMSAIDFEMFVEKQEDPKGDRVKVIMSGKYLPYRKW